MPPFLQATVTIAAKDLRSEMRTKEAINASFAFALNAIKRVPGALNALAAFGRFRFGRAGAMKAMPLTLKPIPDELVKSWVEPLRQSTSAATR